MPLWPYPALDPQQHLERSNTSNQRQPLAATAFLGPLCPILVYIFKSCPVHGPSDPSLLCSHPRAQCPSPQHPKARLSARLQPKTQLRVGSELRWTFLSHASSAVSETLEEPAQERKPYKENKPKLVVSLGLLTKGARGGRTYKKLLS